MPPRRRSNKLAPGRCRKGEVVETEILNVVERIYAAGTARSHWTDLLEEIPDLAGGEAANMLVVRPKTGTMTALSPRTEQGFIDAFFTDWWQHDPTYAHTLLAPVGQVVSLADTGRETFLRSPFHNEFWTTSGHGAELLRANLIMNRDIQVGFGLMPSARHDEITAHMRSLFMAILPHMIRSVEIQWRIQRLEMERSTAISGLGAGVLVVNSDARILRADAAAEAILARGSPLSARHGILTAREHRDSEDLHRLIRSCRPRTTGYSLRGGSAEIRYPDSAPLKLAVLPVPADHVGFALDIDANTRPAALVVLDDLAARAADRVERLRQAYGLTEKEAQVALECLKGGRRDEMAASLKLSDSTVRTHLTRIYGKTGTRRKADLVSLLYRGGFAD